MHSGAPRWHDLRLQCMMSDVTERSNSAEESVSVWPEPLGVFRYEDGQPVEGGCLRAHRVELDPRGATLYLYATFQMTDVNPLPKPDAHVLGTQIVELGQAGTGSFVPLLRFGLQDCRSTLEAVHLVSWVGAGGVDYFGGYARPGAPCDIKLRLDLQRRRVTAWSSGCGDDEWLVLVEDLPVGVEPVNGMRIEQAPGSRGIIGLIVAASPLPEAEAIRPHPLAKGNPVVGEASGHRLQSMRSLWRSPKRHVTVSRDQNRWQGFADVVYAGGQRLLVTYCDGRAHGGGGKAAIRISDDLGQSWGPERITGPADAANERLQLLADGSLLQVGGERLPTVELRRSTDGGESWQPIGAFDVRTFGLTTHYAISHVLECSDSSWLAVGSDTYPIGQQAFDRENRFQIRERLQVFRSRDRGASWELHSLIDSYPSSGHAGSEASILELAGGRLVVYARDSRNDGYPGFRFFSDDAGASWSEPEDLPIQVTGRVKAGLLSDGRMMLTTRVGMGLPALWAWIEDPAEHVGHRTSGIHFNDHRSKGLRDGVLSIDSDGRRGQFTRYLLCPPDGPSCRVDLTAELMVRENHGQAATIAVPFTGKLEIFPDHVRFTGSEATKLAVPVGRFHSYRIVSDKGHVTLSVDGHSVLETSGLDGRNWRNDWSSATISALLFSFGNYPSPDIFPSKASATTVMRPEQITPAVTGLSLWKSFRAVVTEENGRTRETIWEAASGEFPDQYQLDHVLRVEASVSGWDQGYSGWAELPDGRIFVVNYTDDGATAWPATGEYVHCPWIRGTFILPGDLPAPAPRR